MNERILTLAASHFPRDSEGNISATPEMITEFAELIVNECIDRLTQDDFGSVKGVMRIAGAKLKEHFGVE